MMGVVGRTTGRGVIGAGTVSTEFDVFAVSPYVTVALTFVTTHRLTDILMSCDNLSIYIDVLAEEMVGCFRECAGHLHGCHSLVGRAAIGMFEPSSRRDGSRWEVDVGL
jgi:hypothetical protein